MNALQTFDFETHSVRSFMRDGVFWFAATDVCRALGLGNAPQAVSALDADERSTISLNDSRQRGARSLILISEGGLYTVILRCRDAMKPGSLPHRFRKWVTGEVLPALRRAGRYEMRPAAQAPLDPELVDVERMNSQVRWVALVKQVYGRQAAMAAYERSTLPQVRSAEMGALYETPADDGPGCLKHLLRHTAGNGQSVRVVIDAAWRDTTVRGWLSDRGIKVVAGGRREHVAVSERSDFLREVFAATPWADDWFLPLLGCDAVKASACAVNFGPTGQQRAVLLPKRLVQLV